MAKIVKRKRATQDDYRRRFEILFSTMRRVSGGGSLDEILDALVELTSHELRCERSSFLLNDAETGELYSRAAQASFRASFSRCRMRSTRTDRVSCSCR